MLPTGNLFSATPEEKIIENCLKPTVMIHEVHGNSAGTAFIVKSQKVNNSYRNVALTVSHVFDSPTNYTIKLQEYDKNGKIVGVKSHAVILYQNNVEMDLAVVLFETDSPMPCVQLGLDEKIVFSKKVFRIGCGLTDDPRYDKGEITSVCTKEEESFKNHIRTNVYTIFGDSGGPLFDEDTHKVIGICRGVRIFQKKPLFNQSYYIPVGNIKTWNEELNNSLDFIYKNEEMPKLAFQIMKLKQYELKEEE